MKRTRKIGRPGIACLAVLAVFGCASLSTEAPGVDLTGVWSLNANLSDDPGRLRAALHDAAPDLPPGRAIRVDGGSEAGRVRVRTRAPGPVLGDELLTEELDIHQRDSATRIEYDRKNLIVYRWGSEQRGYRGVESGWREQTFVIRAAGRGSIDIERSFSLSESGERLTVVTRLEDAAITQVYELDAAATRELYPSRNSGQ